MTTFNSKSPQLQLRIDRTMAESLGVTMNGVFQTLQTYLGSTYVNLFNKFNQSFQVRVQADADYRRRLDDVANLYVAIGRARWCLWVLWSMSAVCSDRS
jgi:hydrophobic/amphiphilic exporter-1 (mainly G- bacteria), HAE1 family